MIKSGMANSVSFQEIRAINTGVREGVEIEPVDTGVREGVEVSPVDTGVREGV
jgi:hypothetical protein